MHKLGTLGGMETMKTPRLQKRSHKFYCRVRVPRDLRAIVGRTEIVRALGTGDYREADIWQRGLSWFGF